MKLSCNGCRVLRKGCSEDCIIKPCLEWISSPESQGNATLFLAKFFGRTGFLNLLANGSIQNAPAVFRSLLYEASGRLVNPTHGALGLFWTGEWSRCEAAVEAVLTGSDINKVIVVDEKISSTTPMTENHVLPVPTTYDIRHVAKGFNVDIKEKTQFKRIGQVFKTKPRVDFVLTGSDINKAIGDDEKTSSTTLMEENHALPVPTTYDIRHVAKGTNVDIKEKTQFKRVGQVFKIKPRGGSVNSKTLLKSFLENTNVKTIEASSANQLEPNEAVETQVNLELSLSFNSKSTQAKGKKIDY